MTTSKTNLLPIPEGVSETQVLSWAQSILAERFQRSHYFTHANTVKEYLRFLLSHEEREQFLLILLDNQHGVLSTHVLFEGTIDAAVVYPREVVKAALKHNAAAVILAHNHPSGIAEPSQADRNITERLKLALNTVDIRVLDHLVVGGTRVVSFAERGWI